MLHSEAWEPAQALWLDGPTIPNRERERERERESGRAVSNGINIYGGFLLLISVLAPFVRVLTNLLLVADVL